jgi:hypothetical protein
MIDLPDDGRSDDTVAAASNPHGYATGVIACTECLRLWLEPSERWRIYVLQPFDAEENVESDEALTGVYCPECAQREFGQPGRP